MKINNWTLKVEKENAKAMIEGYKKNGIRNYVTIFTATEDAVSLKNDFRSLPKLITPKESDHRKIYPLSIYGKDLEAKSYNYNTTARYIAVLDTIFHIKNEISIWEALCTNGIFDIWEPQAPYNMLSHDAQNNKKDPQDPQILTIRVFEIDHDFQNEITKKQYWNTITPKQVNLVKPVIPNKEFLEIKEKIENTLDKILTKRGYRASPIKDTNNMTLMPSLARQDNNNENIPISSVVSGISQETSATQELINLWETKTGGTKFEQLNQNTQRLIGLFSLESINEFIDNGVTKELWEILDRNRLVDRYGNRLFIDIVDKFKELKTSGGARDLMLNLLYDVEYKHVSSSTYRDVFERIYGLESLRQIKELISVSERIWKLIEREELLMYAGLYGVVGSEIYDYIM